MMRTTPREVLWIQKIKEAFVPSIVQTDMLIGTLLGDGTLGKRGMEYRLHIKHGKKQLSLVQYKRSIFHNITSMPIRVFHQRVKDKNYEFAEFVTLTHPFFSRFYSLFYKEGKKRVPPNIADILQSPLSLAMWFMDDGSSEYAGAAFHTQCFPYNQVELLRTVLMKQFNLSVSIRENKNGYILYILKKSLEQFHGLIRPYMLKDFSYKLVPYEQLHKTP